MLNFIPKKTKNRRAFTLIELIIVIAIVAILVLVAMPRFINFRFEAATSAHNANVRTLKGVAHTYLMEYNLPSANITWTGTKDNDTWNEDQLSTMWAKYISEWPTIPKGVIGIDQSPTVYTVEIDQYGVVTVKPPQVASP